ncbi:Uncharacterised protein [Kluyvera cryocrescens]|uniref:Uncharacterized protein n=1 Tax=Kluyvera cryocrescens TaxID=580 RepID=A0A485AMQ0_KLUCR|nr:Uncharacterised protein [Kluyvera cryocrescens]
MNDITPDSGQAGEVSPLILSYSLLLQNVSRSSGIKSGKDNFPAFSRDNIIIIVDKAYGVPLALRMVYLRPENAPRHALWFV